MADSESPGQGNQIKDAPAGATTSATSKIIIGVLAVSLLGMTIAVGILGAKLANKSDEAVQAASGKVVKPSDPSPGSVPGSEGDDVVHVDDTADGQVSPGPNVPNTATAPPASTVCLDPICVSAAARIMYNLDQSVDPCDNFYDFACGGFIKNTPLLDTNLQGRVTTFQQVKETTQGHIIGILEEPSAPNEIAPVANMKTLYKSCVDTDTIDKDMLVTLTTFFTWLFGEISPWPLLNPAMAPAEADLDLTDIAVKLAKYDIQTIVRLGPGPDWDDPDNWILTVGQPELPRPPSYYEIPRVYLTHTYDFYIKEVAEGLGINNTDADTDVADLVDFEIQISKISDTPEQQRNLTSVHNPTTFGEFVTTADFGGAFDFKKYVEGVLGAVGGGITVNDGDKLNSRSPNYFQKLKPLLDSTPKTTVANYMIWTAVRSLMDTLPKIFRVLQYQFDNKGPAGKDSRKKDCATFVESKMPLVITQGFVDKYVEPGTKKVADEMLTDLKQAFKELLKEEVDWMDEDTKKVSYEKVEAMNVHIVSPDYFLNDPTKAKEKLEEIYKDFTFTNNYFKNKLNASFLTASAGYKMLQGPIDKDMWLMSPVIVNAFYSPDQNLVVLPAGILQLPVFSTKYPKYLTYGTLGFLLGHEITHGFDDSGRMFDKDGIFQQWWDTDVIEKFNTQKQCIIDQYSKYKLEEINMTLRAEFSQGEDIADNGGLRQAFRAYQNWADNHHTVEPPLPGLNYTAKQLFFINFGQFWCTKQTPDMARNYHMHDFHTMGRFRNIGPARNFDEFAKAFNCKESSYMNPKDEDMCTVW